jgi:two-component system OmpR family sensor kinase
MSLRARLLMAAVLIALVLGVAALAIVRTTRSNLVDQIDAQLRSVDERFGTGFGPGAPQGQPEDPSGAPPALSALYIGVISASGDLTTLRVPNLRGDEPPLPLFDQRDLVALRGGGTVTVDSTDPDVDYRVRAEERRGGVALVLALPLDDVHESVRQLQVVVVTAGLAVIGVLGLVIWWVIHLGVRPVRRMTRSAEAIAAGDLSRRVTEGTPGTEAGDLGVALNGMLGRLEEAFDQRTASEAKLRQFVADASHELRTPVATIRGYAELYRTGALDEEGQLDDAMRRTEEEAVRMGTLVDDLLQLARLDQGRPLDRAPVDLGRLVQDAVSDARAVEPARAITTTVREPVTVLGDAPRLHQVVANLVANSLVHAPGSPIDVVVQKDGSEGIVEVHDHGPGMSELDAARAFERFYRADASRSRHKGGSGLGLAIVDATVRAHGGSTEIQTAPGEGMTVRVRLPCRPPLMASPRRSA